MKGLHKSWWVIGAIVVGVLVLVTFAPPLRGAWERNRFALQVKPELKGMEWSDERQICRPVAPPELTTRTCAPGADCYLVGLLALRSREWDNVQTSLGSDPDPLAVFLRGWSDRCSVSLEQALATWSLAPKPIRQKFLAEAEASLAKGEAEPALTRAIIAHELGSTAQSFLVLAEAQSALGNGPLAMDTYYRAIEQDMATARTYGQVGELESNLGILKSARVHLAKAVELDPLSWHYWQTYGWVLFRLEDWADAETAYAHAAALSPEFGSAHGGVALTRLHQGKLVEGRSAVAATLQFTPNVRQQAGFLGEFAHLVAEAGDLEWSAELYTRALGRMPTNENWWNALAATYAQMGECGKMRSVYRMYAEHMAALQKKPAPQPACPA